MAMAMTMEKWEENTEIVACEGANREK